MSGMNSSDQIGARWESEAEEALQQDGYTVIDRAGISDYQGWGVLLGRKGDEFAVLSWSYGSCSGCDRYEDMPNDAVVADLKDNAQTNLTEEQARQAFDEHKSRGW